jgi:hypothetical protein
MNENLKTFLTLLRRQPVITTEVVNFLNQNETASLLGLDGLIGLISSFKDDHIPIDIVDIMIKATELTINQQNEIAENNMNNLLASQTFSNYKEIVTSTPEDNSDNMIINDYDGKSNDSNLDYYVLYPNIPSNRVFGIGKFLFNIIPDKLITVKTKDNEDLQVTYKFIVTVTCPENPNYTHRNFGNFRKNLLYNIIGMPFLNDEDVKFLSDSTNSPSEIKLEINTYRFYKELATSYNNYYSKIKYNDGILFTEIKNIEKCYFDSNGVIIVPKLFYLSSTEFDGDFNNYDCVWRENSDSIMPNSVLFNDYRISINASNSLTEKDFNFIVDNLINDVSKFGIFLTKDVITSKNDKISTLLHISNYKSMDSNKTQSHSFKLNLEFKLSFIFRTLCQLEIIFSQDFGNAIDNVAVGTEKYNFYYKDVKIMLYYNRSYIYCNNIEDLTECVVKRNKNKGSDMMGIKVKSLTDSNKPVKPNDIIPTSFIPIEYTKKEIKKKGLSWIPFGFHTFVSMDTTTDKKISAFSIYGADIKLTQVHVRNVLKLSTNPNDIVNIKQVIFECFNKPEFLGDQPLKIAKIDHNHYVCLFRSKSNIVPKTNINWQYVSDYMQNTDYIKSEFNSNKTLTFILSGETNVRITKRSILRYYCETIGKTSNFNTNLFDLTDILFDKTDSISLDSFCDLFISNSVNFNKNDLPIKLFELIQIACREGIVNDNIIDLILSMLSLSINESISSLKYFISSIQVPIKSSNYPIFTQFIQSSVTNLIKDELDDSINSLNYLIGNNSVIEITKTAITKTGILRNMLEFFADNLNKTNNISDQIIRTNLKNDTIAYFKNICDTVILSERIGMNIDIDFINLAAEKLNPIIFSQLIKFINNELTISSYENNIIKLCKETTSDDEIFIISCISPYRYSVCFNEALYEDILSLNNTYIKDIELDLSVTDSSLHINEFDISMYDNNVHIMFEVIYPDGYDISNVILSSIKEGSIYYTQISGVRYMPDLSVVSLYEIPMYEIDDMKKVKFFMPFTFNTAKLTVDKINWNHNNASFKLLNKTIEIEITMDDISERKEYILDLITDKFICLSKNNIEAIDSFFLGNNAVNKGYTTEDTEYHYLFTKDFNEKYSSGEYENFSLFIYPIPQINCKFYYRSIKFDFDLCKKIGLKYGIGKKEFESYKNKKIDEMFIDDFPNQKIQTDTIIITRNKKGIYTSTIGTKDNEIKIASGLNQYKDNSILDTSTISDMISNIEIVALKEKVENENEIIHNENIKHNLSLLLSTIRWNSKQIENYRFFSDEKSKWIKFSNDSSFMAIGFKSGAKIYIKSGTQYVFCANLYHENISTIIFGNSNLCVTTQYENQFKPFAKLWFTPAGIDLKLNIDFYRLYNGDAANVKYITGNTNKEKDNVIIDVIDDDVEFIQNSTKSFEYTTDKVHIFNSKNKFFIYNLNGRYKKKYISFLNDTVIFDDKSSSPNFINDEETYFFSNDDTSFTYRVDSNHYKTINFKINDSVMTYATNKLQFAVPIFDHNIYFFSPNDKYFIYNTNGSFKILDTTSMKIVEFGKESNIYKPFENGTWINETQFIGITYDPNNVLIRYKVFIDVMNKIINKTNLLQEYPDKTHSESMIVNGHTVIHPLYSYLIKERDNYRDVVDSNYKEDGIWIYDLYVSIRTKKTETYILFNTVDGLYDSYKISNHIDIDNDFLIKLATMWDYSTNNLSIYEIKWNNNIIFNRMNADYSSNIKLKYIDGNYFSFYKSSIFVWKYTEDRKTELTHIDNKGYNKIYFDDHIAILIGSKPKAGIFEFLQKDFNSLSIVNINLEPNVGFNKSELDISSINRSVSKSSTIDVFSYTETTCEKYSNNKDVINVPIDTRMISSALCLNRFEKYTLKSHVAVNNSELYSQYDNLLINCNGNVVTIIPKTVQISNNTGMNMKWYKNHKNNEGSKYWNEKRKILEDYIKHALEIIPQINKNEPIIKFDYDKIKTIMLGRNANNFELGINELSNLGYHIDKINIFRFIFNIMNSTTYLYQPDSLIEEVAKYWEFRLIENNFSLYMQTIDENEKETKYNEAIGIFSQICGNNFISYDIGMAFKMIDEYNNKYTTNNIDNAKDFFKSQIDNNNIANNKIINNILFILNIPLFDVKIIKLLKVTDFKSSLSSLKQELLRIIKMCENVNNFDKYKSLPLSELKSRYNTFLRRYMSYTSKIYPEQSESDFILCMKMEYDFIDIFQLPCYQNNAAEIINIRNNNGPNMEIEINSIIMRLESVDSQFFDQYNKYIVDDTCYFKMGSNSYARMPLEIFNVVRISEVIKILYREVKKWFIKFGKDIIKNGVEINNILHIITNKTKTSYSEQFIKDIYNTFNDLSNTIWNYKSDDIGIAIQKLADDLIIISKLKNNFKTIDALFDILEDIIYERFPESIYAIYQVIPSKITKIIESYKTKISEDNDEYLLQFNINYITEMFEYYSKCLEKSYYIGNDENLNDMDKIKNKLTPLLWEYRNGVSDEIIPVTNIKLIFTRPVKFIVSNQFKTSEKNYLTFEYELPEDKIMYGQKYASVNVNLVDVVMQFQDRTDIINKINENINATLLSTIKDSVFNNLDVIETAYVLGNININKAADLIYATMPDVDDFNPNTIIQYVNNLKKSLSFTLIDEDFDRDFMRLIKLKEVDKEYIKTFDIRMTTFETHYNIDIIRQKIISRIETIIRGYYDNKNKYKIIAPSRLNKSDYDYVANIINNDILNIFKIYERYYESKYSGFNNNNTYIYYFYPQSTQLSINVCNIVYNFNYIIAGLDFVNKTVLLKYEYKISEITNNYFNMSKHNLSICSFRPIKLDNKLLNSSGEPTLITNKEGSVAIFEDSNKEKFIAYYGNTEEKTKINNIDTKVNRGFIITQKLIDRKTATYYYVKKITFEDSREKIRNHINTYILNISAIDDDGNLEITEAVDRYIYEDNNKKNIYERNTFIKNAIVFIGMMDRKYEMDINLFDKSKISNVKILNRNKTTVIISKYNTERFFGSLIEVNELINNKIETIYRFNFYMFDIKDFDFNNNELLLIGLSGSVTGYKLRVGTINLETRDHNSKPIFIQVFDNEINLLSNNIERLDSYSVNYGLTSYIMYKNIIDVENKIKTSHLIIINQYKNYELEFNDEITYMKVSRESGYVALYFNSKDKTEIWTAQGILYKSINGECNWM